MPPVALADLERFIHKENTMAIPGLPRKQGLYDPSFEKDGCGIGFVANINGAKSHDIVRKGLDVLEHLFHRGAQGADPHTGDGAGIRVGAWRRCSDLVFQDNVVRNVDDGDYGFDLRAVDGATLVGNTVKRRTGARQAGGISDVADSGIVPAIKYARGQGNRVKGNPGSVDYPG